MQAVKCRINFELPTYKILTPLVPTANKILWKTRLRNRLYKIFIYSHSVMVVHQIKGIQKVLWLGRLAASVFLNQILNMHEFIVLVKLLHSKKECCSLNNNWSELSNWVTVNRQNALVFLSFSFTLLSWKSDWNCNHYCIEAVYW